MRVLLILAAISFSAAAFAQSAPPKVGNKPLVRVADVMRAVMAGGDAVGIATTIDPEAPTATTTVERKSPPFRRALCWRGQRAAAMRAASAWRIAARIPSTE